MMARRLGRTSYFTPALARRFCQALADECAKAGYVQHDQSQHVKAGRRLTELPHSVTLMPGGQALLGKR